MFSPQIYVQGLSSGGGEPSRRRSLLHGLPYPFFAVLHSHQQVEPATCIKKSGRFRFQLRISKDRPDFPHYFQFVLQLQKYISYSLLFQPASVLPLLLHFLLFYRLKSDLSLLLPVSFLIQSTYPSHAWRYTY